jgi:hypothetical protein
MNVPNIWEWVDDFDGQKTKGMFIFEFQIAFYPKKNVWNSKPMDLKHTVCNVLQY